MLVQWHSTLGTTNNKYPQNMTRVYALKTLSNTKWHHQGEDVKICKMKVFKNNIFDATL